ncbi:MAG: pentapeptide repeat-containing protein, partial [Acidothermales bacterium]|nr:pentapeptide repeat-containing protein [Acidothermales bacterium]
MAVHEEHFSDVDWYGEELADRSFVECTFTDCDLTEARSKGGSFDRCEFRGVRFNASV